MKKIPTLFVRDRATGYVTDEVTPGCEWALAGEGVATRKVDGTCVMLDDDGAWWARREVKPGKTAPPGWVEVDRDDVTGKRVGWEPIERSGFVKFWREAVSLPPHNVGLAWEPGTYELVGPKINGNPDKHHSHDLIPHGAFDITEVSTGARLTSPATAISACRENGWEGVVWWRDLNDPDCDKAKLKVRDYPTPS